MAGAACLVAKERKVTKLESKRTFADDGIKVQVPCGLVVGHSGEPAESL